MSIEQSLVMRASPSLCGIKPSSLFLLEKKFYPEAGKKINNWNRVLNPSGRKIKMLVCLGGRRLLFVYDKNLLEKYFENSKVREYLRKKNYDLSGGVDLLLKELFFRMENTSSFPHEVGVFLGYPVDDVIGYEENSGSNYRYSGCWEVYSGDVENAKNRMESYKKCSRTCISLLGCGVKIENLCESYRKSFGGTL